MTNRGKALAGLAGAAASIGALGTGLVSSDDIGHLFSEAVQNKIAQAGFFFTFAAWLHSGRVKKEIAIQFGAISKAINDVAAALREDLAKHAERISKVEDGFLKISSRVDALEKANKGEK
jgi:hypothetical protein